MQYAVASAKENHLKAVRHAKKLSLWGLAARGTSPSTLSAVEKWGYGLALATLISGSPWRLRFPLKRFGRSRVRMPPSVSWVRAIWRFGSSTPVASPTVSSSGLGGHYGSVYFRMTSHPTRLSH